MCSVFSLQFPLLAFPFPFFLLLLSLTTVHSSQFTLSSLLGKVCPFSLSLVLWIYHIVHRSVKIEMLSHLLLYLQGLLNTQLMLVEQLTLEFSPVDILDSC